MCWPLPVHSNMENKIDLKLIAKSLLPPFLIAAYKYFLDPYYRVGSMWKGTYDYYDQVPAKGQGYDSEVWIKSRLAQMMRFSAELAEARTIPVTHGFRYASLGLLASTILQSKGRVCILDVGGALGNAYLQVRKGLAARRGDIHYFVIDTPRCVREGERLFAGDSQIRFLDALPAPKSIPAVDIVFFSGVLQYIKDYEATIHDLAVYQAPYFLITYISAGDIPTFASAQMNLRKSILPSWFINSAELTSRMDGAGYQLLYAASIEPEDRIDMRNFPDRYRLTHMANLFFCKK